MNQPIIIVGYHAERYSERKVSKEKILQLMTEVAASSSMISYIEISPDNGLLNVQRCLNQLLV